MIKMHNVYAEYTCTVSSQSLDPSYFLTCYILDKQFPRKNLEPLNLHNIGTPDFCDVMIENFHA